MRRWFAILLLGIYAFANTELHQLLKLPVLVQHFVEHRAENRNISLAEFLYLHYMLPQTKDDDYERDMQLPFKADACSVFHIAAPVQHPEFIVQRPQVFSDPASYPLYETPFSCNAVSNDIWQPPRA